MLVLEDVQRCRGVALLGCGVQRSRSEPLAVSAAFHLGHLHQRVELGQSAILRRGQASAQREAVALEAIFGSFINCLQTRLGGFDALWRERQ